MHSEILYKCLYTLHKCLSPSSSSSLSLILPCLLTCCHKEISETSYMCALKLCMCNISHIQHWLLRNKHKIDEKISEKYLHVFVMIFLTCECHWHFPQHLKLVFLLYILVPKLHSISLILTVCAVPFTAAWCESTRGCHGTFWMTMHEPLVVPHGSQG